MAVDVFPHSVRRARPRRGGRGVTFSGAPSAASWRVCDHPWVTSLSVHAAELHEDHDDDARAFVDAVLGGSDEWRSPLLRYRLSSGFQADWKAEVGHWLKRAQRLQFLDLLLLRLLKRAKDDVAGNFALAREANDVHHRRFASEIAPAMAVHYFVGTGWTFKAWEPETGGKVDVDVGLLSPDGGTASLQIKAPDVLGEVVRHRIVDGEHDERVVAAVQKAARQLPAGRGSVNLIVVTANRRLPLSQHLDFLLVDLVGSTVGAGGGVSLPCSSRGRFWDEDWRHISAVVLLDYVRGVDTFKYACTVLTNPAATVLASPTWFPRARVCVLEGSAFRWVRGQPDNVYSVPDGTVLLDG